MRAKYGNLSMVKSNNNANGSIPKNEILITIGVSEAVDAVLRSVLNPGDEILICEPCYVSYQPLAAPSTSR